MPEAATAPQVAPPIDNPDREEARRLERAILEVLEAFQAHGDPTGGAFTAMELQRLMQPIAKRHKLLEETLAVGLVDYLTLRKADSPSASLH